MHEQRNVMFEQQRLVEGQNPPRSRPLSVKPAPTYAPATATAVATQHCHGSSCFLGGLEAELDWKIIGVS